MAIVTSPSPRVSPFFISSRLGLVSATQRSWAGFVWTPTLGLDMVVVVVVVVDMMMMMTMMEEAEGVFREN